MLSPRVSLRPSRSSSFTTPRGPHAPRRARNCSSTSSSSTMGSGDIRRLVILVPERSSARAYRKQSQVNPGVYQTGASPFCSSAVAQELWTWFDDCEQHSALLDREVWKVHVCQRAKE